MKNTKTQTQKLNKKEKTAKDNIELGMKVQEDRWTKTAKRLLEQYNGRYMAGPARKSRFTVNTMFSLVNLLLPNLIFTQPYLRTIPKNAKYFKSLPDGAKLQIDNIKAATIREATINHLYTKIDAIGEQKKALLDSFFYGFGLTKVGYSFETISTPDRDYIVKDTPFLKRVDPKDFFWHPLATGLDDSPFLIHRVLTTKTKLKEQDIYSKADLDLIIPEIPQHLKDRTKHMASIKSSDYVTLYEEHDQETGMIYTFAGENRILLDKRENEYEFNGPHFSMVKLSGDNDTFPGIPLLAMVEDEAIALNEMMTLMMEHARKYPAMIFTENGAIDEDDIERIRNGEQGSIHTVNKIDGIKIQNPLAMGGEYFSIVNMLQGMIDRILGVPDFQRASGSTRKSATEASFIQGDATVRREYYLQIVKAFMLDGVKKLGHLQAQFQDEEEEILASGELRGMEIKYDKSDIQGDYQFDFDIETLKATSAEQANNLNQALTIFAGNEILHPVIRSLDPMKLGTKIFKKMGMNIEEFQTQAIETMVFVPPKEENKIARKGDPMPAPKRGEPHDLHLKEHAQDMMQNGPNEEILNHIAATMILKQKEEAERGGNMIQAQVPQPGGEMPAEMAAPAGPLQAPGA